MRIKIICPKRALPLMIGFFTLVGMLELVGLAFLVVGPKVDILKIDRARKEVKKLDEAVTEYFRRNSLYPPTLGDLLPMDPSDGSRALPDVPLLDPWRQPYIYEPRNLHPQTGKPLIYSTGPPEAPRRISNWD